MLLTMGRFELPFDVPAFLVKFAQGWIDLTAWRSTIGISRPRILQVTLGLGEASLGAQDVDPPRMTAGQE